MACRWIWVSAISFVTHQAVAQSPAPAVPPVVPPPPAEPRVPMEPTEPEVSQGAQSPPTVPAPAVPAAPPIAPAPQPRPSDAALPGSGVEPPGEPVGWPTPPFTSETPSSNPPLGDTPDVDADLAWYDLIQVRAFADAYAGVDFNFPRNRRAKPIRAYDHHDGFSLSWVGLDLEKAAEPVGGVIALRFGPTAERLGSACVDGMCDSDYGLSIVKQGFVSWKPGGSHSSVQLDLGKFDTPFGAEVAESQYNFNYTRGALYWLGQPAYHTGFRLSADLDRAFAFKLLAVNGWNRSVDNNLGKTFGLQATFRVPANDGSDDDRLAVSLGYLVGPEWSDSAELNCPSGTRPNQSEPSCEPDTDAEGGLVLVDRGGANTEGLRHFLDLVLSLAPVSELGLSLNASLGIDNQRNPSNLAEFEPVLWWGVAGAVRYAVDDRWGIAARGEYYNDRDGYTTGFVPAQIGLLTGTLTLDYSPARALKLFADGRVDWSSRQIFPSSVRDDAGTALSLTVGAVVMAY